MSFFSERHTGREESLGIARAKLLYRPDILPRTQPTALKHWRNDDLTSCAGGHHNMPLPPASLLLTFIFTFIRQVAVLFRHNDIFVFIRQVAPVPACWLFKTSATS